MIFWEVQSKPSLCDLLHFETRPLKFTNVTMEHTTNSIAYLTAANHEIRLVYVMKLYVKFIYVNSFLKVWSFSVDRIQWHFLGQTVAARGGIFPLTPSLSILRLHLSTKPSAAIWGMESVPELWRNFTHWRSCLTEKVLLKLKLKLKLISIYVWCRSSNYKWATGKTWAVSVAGGYYNRVIRLLRWISHI